MSTGQSLTTDHFGHWVEVACRTYVWDERARTHGTLGPIEQRPTHMSPWRYRSSL